MAQSMKVSGKGNLFTAKEFIFGRMEPVTMVNSMRTNAMEKGPSNTRVEILMMEIG